LCRRGGDSARLLLAAANRTQEEAQQRRHGYLEDGYLQQEDEEQEDDPLSPEQQSNTPSSSINLFYPLYPAASHVPVAEDPPMSDAMRQFLCAVLSQAQSCLSGVSVSHKHGVTSPDEVLKYIIKGKAVANLTEATPEASESLKLLPVALHNILFTVQVCEEAEVMDAILQLSYFLSTMKLACLVNK
jgi:hypothetical protein